MSRYFLALPLPESVRASLTDARPPKLPGIKLVRPDQMHVTLHFLGELRQDGLEGVMRAMDTVESPRFPIRISGVGAFPEDGPPRVVWAGIDALPELSALHRQIGERLQRETGFQPEERPYHPHVTLARVKRRLKREQLQDYWDQHRELSIPEIPADRFVLYESVFADDRLEYREDATWELTDETT